ncbi:MAG: aspartyl protease family protein [candidate division Zixibacteria bacterium]
MKTTLKILAVLVFAMGALAAIGFFSGIISTGNSGCGVTVLPATTHATVVDASYLRALTFMEAVESFVLNPPARASFTHDQQAYLRALESVESAHYYEAEPLFSELLTSEDSTVRNLSRKSLVEMFWVQQRWEDLVSWARSDPTLISDSILEEGDLVCARAFETFPREEYRIPPAPFTLATSTIPSGHVMVEVEINGHKKQFALDTGADLTVVTDDIVEECGVEVMDQVAESGTSTEATVEFRPGMIREMRVGDILVKNHPVYVMNGDDFEFSVAGVTIIDIDGIIGLPFYMKLAVTQDFGAEQITFARPEASAKNNINLFWFGSPLVRLTSDNGVPLVFYLDTGANRTRITRRFIDQLSITRARTITAEAMGAGGSQEYEALVVDSVWLLLGTHSIFFEKVRTQINDSYGTVISEDGLMGIDVASGGAMHIDFSNGRLDLSFSKNRSE